MAKYKVKWIQVIEYQCSHEVEADSAAEAISIAASLDSDTISFREESDNFDKEQEAIKQEE